MGACKFNNKIKKQTTYPLLGIFRTVMKGKLQNECFYSGTWLGQDFAEGWCPSIVDFFVLLILS